MAAGQVKCRRPYPLDWSQLLLVNPVGVILAIQVPTDEVPAVVLSTITSSVAPVSRTKRMASAITLPLVA